MKRSNEVTDLDRELMTMAPDGQDPRELDVQATLVKGLAMFAIGSGTALLITGAYNIITMGALIVQNSDIPVSFDKTLLYFGKWGAVCALGVAAAAYGYKKWTDYKEMVNEADKNEEPQDPNVKNESLGFEESGDPVFLSNLDNEEPSERKISFGIPAQEPSPSIPLKRGMTP